MYSRNRSELKKNTENHYSLKVKAKGCVYGYQGQPELGASLCVPMIPGTSFSLALKYSYFGFILLSFLYLPLDWTHYEGRSFLCLIYYNLVYNIELLSIFE